MKINQDEQGFVPVLAVLLIILVVGLGTFATWRYLDTKDGSPSPARSNDQQNDVSIIENRLQEFYDSYAGSDLGGKNPRLDLDQLQAKGLISTAGVERLKSQNVDYDNILCTQGGSGEPFAISGIEVNDNTAVATVSQKYEFSGENKISVELEKDTLWQISNISCTF